MRRELALRPREEELDLLVDAREEARLERLLAERREEARFELEFLDDDARDDVRREVAFFAAERRRDFFFAGMKLSSS